MYAAEQVSSAPGSNTEFHPARRVIRWKELTAMEYLADGAMCSCYTAKLEGHDTVVVKKPSRRSRESVEEIERELIIEKAYLASLRHPHIIRLIGSGSRGLKNNFGPFLVLEYLAGNTLGKLISERRRGRLVPPHFVLDGKKNYIPWAQAMGWAQDLASALRYMHDEASPGHVYICRDLKPDNIGFTADGTLKIFDFGLAKRVPRKAGSNQMYIMTSRTGTIRYMAPEAFLGHRYNEKVDVYAWSHVVAEMLSLDVPYDHMGTTEFRETVALGRRRPPVERRWPRSIQKLLKRCWAREPSVRPAFGDILEGGVLEEAAGPQHSWFHHLLSNSLRRPATPGRDRDGGRGWATNAGTDVYRGANNGAPATAAAAAAAAGGGAGASRGRIATIDAGDPNHRSPVPNRRNGGDHFVEVEKEMEAPAATVPPAATAAPPAPPSVKERCQQGSATTVTSGDGAAGDEEGRGRGNSAHGRIFRLGPLVLPVCFFGGGGRA